MAQLTNGNHVAVIANGGYALSVDGGQNFTKGTIGFADPVFARDPASDTIWTCGISSAGLASVKIAWVDFGASPLTFSTPITATDLFFDRPGLAIGPPVGGGQIPRYYVMGTRTDEKLWGTYSADLSTPWIAAKRLWPNPGDSGNYAGWGVEPVVLDGPIGPNTGRIVMAARDADPDGGGRFNNNLPCVTYCEDGGLWTDPDGVDWRPDVANDIIRVGAGLPLELRIVATTIDAGVSAPNADTPFLVDRRKCAPSLAIRRDLTPNPIAIAFYARAMRADTTAEDRNTDIYICQSLDGGLTFSADPADQQVFQLTDAMLSAPSNLLCPDKGPDQIMPAITYDACGGMNVVFYDTRNDTNPCDDETWLDIYHVRILGFGTANPVVASQRRLTTTSFLLPTTGIGFLGDYQHMSAAGPTPQPTIYCAYVQVDQDGMGIWNQTNCYLRQIKLKCLADMNQNGLTNLEDVLTFEAAFSLESGVADLNEDECVNDQDDTLFWAAFQDGG